MLKIEAYMLAAQAAVRGYITVVHCRGETCCLQAQMTRVDGARTFWGTLKAQLKEGETLRMFGPELNKFFRKETQ